MPYFRYISEVEELLKEIKRVRKEELSELNDKIKNTNTEINLINGIRENLFKIITKNEEALCNIGLYEKEKYERFIPEETILNDDGEELNFLSIKLEVLLREMKDTKRDYDKIGGFIKIINGQLETTERRKIEAMNEAQNRFFAYLKEIFNYYLQHLKNRIMYYKEFKEIAKLYREHINSITLKIEESNYEENLKVIKFFLKSLEIKEKIKNNEIGKYSRLSDFQNNKIKELKDTKYEKYFLFTQNIFYLYKSITKIFKENVISQLGTLYTEEVNCYDEFPNVSYYKHKDILSGDFLWTVDCLSEYSDYNIRDLKITKYEKLEEKKLKDREIIESEIEKGKDIKKNIELIKENKII